MLEKRFLVGDYTPFCVVNEISKAGKENISPGVMAKFFVFVQCVIPALNQALTRRREQLQQKSQKRSPPEAT